MFFSEEGAWLAADTEVDPSPGGFTSASKLALSSGIAAAINKTVREHSATAKIFGGEIGPHNGGSPPCGHVRAADACLRPLVSRI